MPGSRLTERERRQITSGIADGLAYAEIARRLDRPTSTVTREVLRNGGPTAYHADLAQLTSERRARRRRRPTRPGPATATEPHGRDADAVREYEATIAALFTQAGLPRMTARVLACLYTTDTGSLTAAELAERLRVSPASISKAIALLEGQDHVRRERDGQQRNGQRRDRYVVDDEVCYQSVMASARSTARLAEVARRGVDVLGRETPAAVRLDGIARFVECVAEGIARAADDARALLRPE